MSGLAGNRVDSVDTPELMEGGIGKVGGSNPNRAEVANSFEVEGRNRPSGT